MARRWRSFDHAVTNREFSEIPSRDVAALFRAMKKYASEQPSGWVVKDYGDGLLMIKAPNQTHGRCLFFTIQGVDGADSNLELVALLGYKKEKQEAPKQVVETARQRMKLFRDR